MYHGCVFVSSLSGTAHTGLPRERRWEHGGFVCDASPPSDMPACEGWWPHNIPRSVYTARQRPSLILSQTGLSRMIRNSKQPTWRWVQEGAPPPAELKSVPAESHLLLGTRSTPPGGPVFTGPTPGGSGVGLVRLPPSWTYWRPTVMNTVGIYNRNSW